MEMLKEWWVHVKKEKSCFEGISISQMGDNVSKSKKKKKKVINSDSLSKKEIYYII